jgi:hypothetical protein
MHARPEPSSLRRLIGGCVLALLFLIVQQHASLHWLSHAIDAVHQKAAPAGDACDECAGLSAFAAAAPSTTPVIPIVEPYHALPPAETVASIASALRLAFRSRAPPVLS